MQLIYNEFLDRLTSGVARTRHLIDQVTEYRGGPTKTEYLLTSDLAREFIESGYQVRVECPNRTLLNGLNARRSTTPRLTLKGRRTDVAVLDNLLPLAIVEIKIGIKRLNGLKKDLDKITDTIELMKSPRHAANVLGASVFEIHIRPTKKRQDESHFRAAITKVVHVMQGDLVAYAKSRPNFDFKLEPLQSEGVGIVGGQLVEDEHESYFVEDGHATQFFAITIKSNRAPPQAETPFERMKLESLE